MLKTPRGKINCTELNLFMYACHFRRTHHYGYRYQEFYKFDTSSFYKSTFIILGSFDNNALQYKHRIYS